VGPPPVPRLGFTKETPLETPGTQQSRAPQVDPPRSDEGLDDWFARRLEAKGINAGRPRLPVARVLAVAALAVAVGLLLWVLTGIGNSGSSTATTHTGGGGSTATPPPPSSGGSSTGKKTKPPAIPWKTVPLTIFNGYSATVPAAATAESQIKNLGGTVVNITNTSPQTTTATYVAYPPGKLAAARAVAQRFHLGKPVPVAEAAGVPTSLSTVAIVLGPQGIPTAGG
jgi:hypothetical protein